LVRRRSTLDPNDSFDPQTATSPSLSAIQLDFFAASSIRPSIETRTKDTGDDLRWVANEVARIEREFDGAVKLTVLRDRGFKVVFDTLNILQF